MHDACRTYVHCCPVLLSRLLPSALTIHRLLSSASPIPRLVVALHPCHAFQLIVVVTL